MKIIIKHDIREIYLFALSIICGLIYQATGDSTNLKMAGIFFGSLGIFIYYYNRRRSSNKLLVLWIALAMYMLIIGIAYRFPSWPQHVYTFLRMDLSYILYVTIGIILGDNIYNESVDKIMKYLVFISLVFQLFAIVNFNNATAIYDRNLTTSWNGVSYIYWGISCNVAIYAGYKGFTSLLNREKMGIINISYIGCFLLYVVLGVMFQKRAVIVNALVLLIVGFALNLKQNQRKAGNVFFRMIGIMFLIIIVIVISYNSIDNVKTVVDETLIRFTGSYGRNGSLSTYDRQREANQFVENTKVYQLITGYGIGNYVSTSILSLHGMLHIGYYNIVYKGGLLYILFWLYIFRKTYIAIKDAHMINTYGIVCLGITISAFVSMIYEFSWSETIMPVCYFPFIAHIVNRNYQTNQDV